MGCRNMRGYVVKKNILIAGLLAILVGGIEAKSQNLKSVGIARPQTSFTETANKTSVPGKPIQKTKQLIGPLKIGNGSVYAYSSKTVEQFQSFSYDAISEQNKKVGKIRRKMDRPIAHEVMIFKRTETEILDDGDGYKQNAKNYQLTEKAHYLQDKSGKIHRIVESRSEKN